MFQSEATGFGFDLSALTKGFNFSTDWPILSILSIGLIVALRSGKKEIYKKTKRTRKKRKRR